MFAVGGKTNETYSVFLYALVAIRLRVDLGLKRDVGDQSSQPRGIHSLIVHNTHTTMYNRSISDSRAELS